MTDHDTLALTEPRPPGSGSDEGLTAGTRVGRLVVLEQIGEGGMGRVYSAYDPVLDRRVCLKFLKQNTSLEDASVHRHRMITEAQTLAQLSHPNILPLYDVGEFEEQVYLVTEYIDGWTLDRWVAESSPSTDAILAALLDAGAGLSHAHEHDIIHRDFKPENVMMGRDGRVRVMDYGLASRSAESTGTTETSGDGQAYGTPRFMAPEQREGLLASAATDQYSWCLTLAACLGVDVRAGAVSADAIAALPLSEVQRRAVSRGLSANSEARFETLPALLAEMTPRPARTRRLGLIAATTAVASLAAFMLFWGQERDPCPLRPAPTSTWRPEQRDAARQAFVATGLPYAGDAFDRMTPLLDGYLDDWSQQQQSACRATHVANEQSTELLDRRMACLDTRLRQVDALGRLFARPDAGIVDASMNAVLGLPGLASCADRESLLSATPLPLGDAAQKTFASLDTALSTAWAEQKAGHYDEAKQQLDDLEQQTREFDHLPTTARFLEYRGATRRSMAMHVEARQDFEDALFLSQAANARHVAAQTSLELAILNATTGAPQEQIERWFSRADLLTERLGDDELRSGWLHRYGQYLVLARGDTKRGLPLLKSALDSDIAREGADSPRVANVMNSYAWALYAAGRIDEALEFGRRALDGTERSFGAHHNNFLVSANNYAGILNAADRTDEALALLERAHTGGVASVGAEHPNVMLLQLTWAGTLIGLERYADALPKFHQQRELLGKKFGPQHRLYGNAAAGEGVCLREVGRLDESEAVMQDALDAGGDAYPPVERVQLAYELAQTLARTAGNGARIRSLLDVALENVGDDESWRTEIAAFADKWKDAK